MPTTITINPTTQYYIEDSGSAEGAKQYHSFSYIMNTGNDLAQAMIDRPQTGQRIEAIPDDLRGTMEAYERYTALLEGFRQHPANKHTLFSRHTPRALRKVLGKFHQRRVDTGSSAGSVIRVILGNRTTGEAWLQECDVVGYVGRSSGLHKIPLLLTPLRRDNDPLALTSSSGGGAMLCDCILAVHHLTTGAMLYQAKNLRLPVLEVRSSPNAALPWELVSATEGVFSRHTTRQEANALASFLGGHSHVPPHGFPKESEEFSDDLEFV